jgi:hypothetical protein
MTDPVIPRRFRLAQLQPVQRALAGERRAARPACREFPRQHRQHRIVPELIVVGEIFVAERDAEHALQHHRPDAVLNQFGHAPIGKAGAKALGEPDRAIGRAQKQRARIRRDDPAIKASDHLAPFDGCKIEQSGATLCRHREAPLLSGKSLSQKNFHRFGVPMHLHAVRNPG